MLVVIITFLSPIHFIKQTEDHTDEIAVERNTDIDAIMVKIVLENVLQHIQW